MTVKINIFGKDVEYLSASDLIEKLQQVPGDTLVVMSKDEEGNYFSPWCDVTTDRYYDPDSTWSGELRNPDEKELDDKSFYYDEEERERMRSLPKCIVLWPTN